MNEPRLLALGAKPVRLLIAIHLANILTLVGMNMLTLHSVWMPWVYAAGLAACWGLVGRLRLGTDRPSGWTLGRRDRWWIDLGFAFLVGGIALSRVGYIAEAWLGHVIEPVCWDDWFHLQDISSVANTERFPPTSAMRPDRYLSHHPSPELLCLPVSSHSTPGQARTRVASSPTRVAYITHIRLMGIDLSSASTMMGPTQALNSVGLPFCMSWRAE